MCMRCRVTNKIVQVLCSTTREERVVEILEAEEEVEDLVEVADNLYATTADNKATMRETVQILLPPIRIVNPLIM